MGDLRWFAMNSASQPGVLVAWSVKTLLSPVHVKTARSWVEELIDVQDFHMWSRRANVTSRMTRPLMNKRIVKAPKPGRTGAHTPPPPRAQRQQRPPLPPRLSRPPPQSQPPRPLRRSQPPQSQPPRPLRRSRLSRPPPLLCMIAGTTRKEAVSNLDQRWSAMKLASQLEVLAV